MPTPPKLASLLDCWIKPAAGPMSATEKLDVLDRAVEWMRLELRHGRNQLDMDVFLRSYLAPSSAGLDFARAAPAHNDDKGTPPLHLQPKLLLFLLLYHREGAAPLEVIDGLVAKILPELRPSDFVRTKTGVTRCYTNIRFAAGTLRSYGFLRYTQKERYKAWVLTLPGIIVAAHFLKTDGWRISDTRREADKDLHRGIYQSLRVVEDYELFIDTLSSLLRPDSGVFKTFGPALEEAFSLLLDFNLKANDTDLKYNDRQSQCRILIDRLDQRVGSEFYEEFSAAMNIEALIKAVEARSQP
jgi:hypothetical protein